MKSLARVTALVSGRQLRQPSARMIGSTAEAAVVPLWVAQHSQAACVAGSDIEKEVPLLSFD